MRNHSVSIKRLIILKSIEQVIGGAAYKSDTVNKWTQGIVNSCLEKFIKLSKPYKYIVTCVIMQKNGAGLHTTSSCFWDNNSDGKFLNSKPFEYSSFKVLVLLWIKRKRGYSVGELVHVLCGERFRIDHLMKDSHFLVLFKRFLNLIKHLANYSTPTVSMQSCIIAVKIGRLLIDYD